MATNTPACALFLAALLAACGCRAAERPGTVTVSLDAPANTFLPAALGAGIDGHQAGDEKRMLSPANVKEMLTAGLLPISYRLRTELAVDAWHWNPRGTWSDPAHKQGYWISDATPGKPIRVCYGYHLPRRGDTSDEANEDGYSRLDDGDPETFWKSNPYLDTYFTHEPNAEHPQWVVIDLGQWRQVNAVKIRWAVPYATHYTVEYGGDDVGWQVFQKGTVEAGKGGDVFLRFESEWTESVRIRMTEGSRTAPPGSTDVRDGLGYAIREVEAGVVGKDGKFRDWVIHKPSMRQTMISVSSTDPWHRASDLDEHVEQPGFDLLEASGLTNGLPMMAPIALVYDTPENAVNEVKYLRARGYNVPRIEMGEEPDGQLMSPTDYAAVYLQWASAIHAAVPEAQLGGPCFVTLEFEKGTYNWKTGRGWWIRHFLDYLNARNRLGDFTFFSFEWYPFDDVCKPSPPQLLRHPWMLQNAFELVRENGITKDIPIVVSEFGYSPFSGRAEVDVPGALLNADIVGLFLTLGGETAYLYGYEPNYLEEYQGCTWGNLMLFQQDKKGGIRSRMAVYYGARMVTQEWVQPGGGRHTIYQTAADLKTADGDDLVTAYAIHRPDKRWAFLLINKDPGRPHEVVLHFARGGKDAATQPAGPCDVCQFSPAQYVWHADGPHGYAARSEPPVHTQTAPGSRPRFELPAYSLTVVRTAPME